MSRRTILPAELSPIETNALLCGGVAPRPIALASTISLEGVRNLAPFSFFNAFGSNPPTVAFAPNRRGWDGTVKHTYPRAHNKPRQCRDEASRDAPQGRARRATWFVVQGT